jgi:hypothetical protein
MVRHPPDEGHTVGSRQIFADSLILNFAKSSENSNYYHKEFVK